MVPVVPFISLELVNRQNLPGEFPFVLFAFLWFLATLFVFLVMSISSSIQHGNKTQFNITGLLFRVVLLILVGWCWFEIIADQMPCFLGGMNCD